MCENYFYVDLNKNNSGHKELHTPVMNHFPVVIICFYDSDETLKPYLEKSKTGTYNCPVGGTLNTGSFTIRG